MCETPDLRLRKELAAAQILQQPRSFSLCLSPYLFSVLAWDLWKKFVFNVSCHGLGWRKADKMLTGHHHNLPSSKCL